MNPAIRTVYTRNIEVVKGHEGRVRAVMSTEDIDRQGDIIRASGWDLKNFLQHPVLLANHDYGSLQSQIGEWSNVSVKGRKLVGDANYYIGKGNAQADWGFGLAERGMAAFSVGFRPDWGAAVELDASDSFFGSFEFKGQELLETSHVTIPANPAALQRMAGVQTLHPVMRDIVDEAVAELNGDDPAVPAVLDGIDIDALAASIVEATPDPTHQAEQFAEQLAERIVASLTRALQPDPTPEPFDLRSVIDEVLSQEARS